MNILDLVTAQDITAQLARERATIHNARELAEHVANWRQRIRLWNRLQRRYLEALARGEHERAAKLYTVLRETREVS